VIFQGKSKKGFPSIFYLGDVLILAFVVYFFILLSIAIFSCKRNKITSDTDFIAGGRSLNFWVTAFTAHASDMSSWLFMAFPAAIYVSGLIKIWAAVGPVVGMFLNWQFIAPKLREVTERYNCLTVSGYLSKRFDDRGFISIITALISFFFFVIYLSSGLCGMGMLFDSIFGVDYHIAIIIGIAVVMIYTSLGGFVTVAWQDLFQGLFLLLMIFIVPAIAFLKVGSVDVIISKAAEYKISLSVIPVLTISSVLLIIQTILELGLGYFGQLHILSKFIGIKNGSDIYKSKYVGLVWQVLSLSAAVAVGLVALAYFPARLSNPELIFVEMVKGIFQPFMVGFVLCAILAAIISTMDSQVLVISSVLTEDFYKKFLRPKANGSELLLVSRLSVILACILAYVIASSNSKSIYELVLYAWSGLGSAFGPVLLFSFYSKNINRRGAIAGILSGAFTVLSWKIWRNWIPFDIAATVPGFLVSSLSIYFVSKIKIKGK